MTNQINDEVTVVSQAFADGVAKALGLNLYGIYTYGAAFFDDGGAVQDVDCHVVVKSELVEDERNALMALFAELADTYGSLGGEVDAYFILLEDARNSEPPHNQLREIVDDSWALHCAHVRAGRCGTLWGPEPVGIFPAPSWRELVSALNAEVGFVRRELDYPAYCVLNLCRIVQSFADKDVVKSKHASGLWALERFPEWKPLIRAAMRHYAKAARDGDENMLRDQVRNFLAFAEDRIAEYQED